MSSANKVRGAHMVLGLTGLVHPDVLAGILSCRPTQSTQSDEDRSRQLEKAAAKRMAKKAKALKRT